MSDLPTLRTAVTTAEQAHAAITTNALAAGKAWDANKAALGLRPIVPSAALPVEPPTPRPPDLTIAARAPTERVLRAKWERDLATAESTLTRATDEHTARSTRAAIVTAHLSAARRAPADILRAQVGALGPLGPVVLDVPERTDDTPRTAPWVTLGYRHDDGTVAPMDAASTGERAIATYWLQRGVRYAAHMLDKQAGWSVVPVVADFTAWHDGPMPELRGVVWLERGAPVGAGLEVRA